jgi:hypothetical protein
MRQINNIKNFIITLCMLFLTTNVISQTTLLSEDFSSMSTGYVTQSVSTSSNYQVVNNCTSETWEVTTSHNEECGSCTGRFAAIEWYGSSCTQDNVFITKQFSPTETAISISFDYLFDHYSADYFEVYLYNETDGSQVGVDLVYVTIDTDDSFSGSVNLTGGNSTSDNYSLRFHYYGRYDYGASFDNILVTESSSGGGGGGDTEVTIGTGTSESALVPSYGYYDYSWSGMIYLQSEIATEGEIESISFYVDASSPSSYIMNNQKIYIGHTTITQFPSSSVQEDFSSNYATSDWTLVYDGTIDWSHGWEEITLSTPFTYNNTDNLIVKVENRNGSYTFSYPEFDYTSSTRRAAYEYQDNSYPTTTGDRTNNRPNVRFGISAPNPLPITLISFSGELMGSDFDLKTNLRWEVESQLNNDYFLVEHSIDGYIWEGIGSIIGAGTTSEYMSYESIHNEPVDGYNYYRLTQVDYDGQYETFKPISIFVNIIDEREYVVRKTNLIGQNINEYYDGPILILWNNGEVTREFNKR